MVSWLVIEGTRDMDSVRRHRIGSGRSARDRRLAPIRLLVMVAAYLPLVAACSSDDAETSDTATDAASFEQAEDSQGGESADLAGDGVAAADSAADDTAASDGDDEAAMEEGDAVADGGADVEAPRPAAESDENPLGAGGTRVTPTAADLGRKLIFTAFVTVGVDDVAAASAEATSIIETMGGFLFGQETTGGPEASSQLTFKVLPEDFNRALEQLGSVGELRNQSVTTDDVTERIVDLESRIQVAELGVAQLRRPGSGAVAGGLRRDRAAVARP